MNLANVKIHPILRLCLSRLQNVRLDRFRQCSTVEVLNSALGIKLTRVNEGDDM